MATLLGFDFGTAKIGIAVGQTISGTATPLTTIRYRKHKPDWTRIESIVGDWKPDAAVVGMPMKMDDTEEDWSDKVRRFARQLSGRFGLEVHLVDERLTTMAAERDFSDELARAARRKQGPTDLVDAYAAKLILETWLHDQR